MTAQLELAERGRRFTNRTRLVHAENPDRPGHALCGLPLSTTKPVSPGSPYKCVVCQDLARRTYTER